MSQVESISSYSRKLSYWSYAFGYQIVLIDLTSASRIRSLLRTLEGVVMEGDAVCLVVLVDDMTNELPTIST